MEGKDVQFTLEVRNSAEGHTTSLKQHTSFKPGRLCFQPQYFSDELRDYLNLDTPELDTHFFPSDDSSTKLWSLALEVEAANGKQSGLTNSILGTPWSYSRWFSIGRTLFPWLAPRHGHSPFSSPDNSVLCSFLRLDGSHLVVLAISGTEDVLTELKSDPKGNIVILSVNDREAKGYARVVVAVGKSFESACARVIDHARDVVRGFEDTSRESLIDDKSPTEMEVSSAMDDWYDGLTYCTWNGLGQGLSREKILQALEILDDNDIKGEHDLLRRRQPISVF